MREAQIEWSDSHRLVKDPLVSVVMTAYNHERYLAEAIEGVVRQDTSFSVELLIGEDCSTDGTRNIALSYQKRFPEMIRVIASEHNVGAHASLTRLLGAAQGKYIAFCDGDDFWHRTDKLQRQIEQFCADESVVCVSTGYRTVSADSVVVETTQQPGCDLGAIAVEYKDLVLGTPLNPNTCTVVVQASPVKEALNGNSLFSDHTLLIGDFPLWLEVMQHGRMMHLPEAFASYRLSPNSATRRSDPLWALRVAISVIEVRYRALERYPLPGGNIQTSRAELRFAKRLLIGAARVGDRATARCQWRRLISLGARPTLSDMACMAIALTPLPRRLLTVIARRMIRYLEMRGWRRNGAFGSLRSEFGDFGGFGGFKF
jgi:glycosyltransferase involved in cell wall biosynthesis